jgi:flagellar hook-basal body complex protein FliE
MNPIQGINIAPPTLPGAATSVGSPEGVKPFKNFLVEAIGHVNDMQQNADKAVEALVTGGDADMAEVLTSVQKADLSFRMMMQIRNKLVQAYQEIKEIRI